MVKIIKLHWAQSDKTDVIVMHCYKNLISYKHFFIDVIRFLILYFLPCSDQLNIPKLLTYKLRIDADKVDSTKRIEDRLTR